MKKRKFQIFGFEFSSFNFNSFNKNERETSKSNINSDENNNTGSRSAKNQRRRGKEGGKKTVGKKKEKKEKQRAPPLLLFKSSQPKPQHRRWIGQHGWQCILASKHLKLEKSGKKEVHRKVQGKARQIRAFFKTKYFFCLLICFPEFLWI